ncbi:MAG TPA: HK97 family phage prohead protease [Acidimicrobiales bacterium]|nr:HK97 family phage prohead protease [Acidimicrobiales bacterium]
MQIRAVDTADHTVTGVCVPYGEISFLTPNPLGEKVTPGAFTRSLSGREDKVFLYREHDHSRPVGRSMHFTDERAGLVGTFRIRPDDSGAQVLADVADGWLPHMSVGFKELRGRTDPDSGVHQVLEGHLMEVSLLSLPAYDGARVLASRGAVLERTPVAGDSWINLPPQRFWSAWARRLDG